MHTLKMKWELFFARSRTSGLLNMIYALGLETLFIGYLYFIGFFTLETLLPGFITVRFSLAKFFFALVLGTMLLSLLGRFLNFSFTWNFTKKSPALWIGFLWALGILTVSLMKFPIFFIPIIITLLLLSGFLFWTIFFEAHS